MVDEQTYSSEETVFDVTNRLRSIEGKYNLLRDRVLIINNNMIEEYKKNLIELKAINQSIKEIKEDIFKIKENLRHVVMELEIFAKKEDVKFLEKYINLWNPMNFVTQSDVLRMIEESKHHKSKEIKEEKHAKSRL
ncbi:MAG TPA: hypothetical protein VJI68_00025 [Candidatus Nanoarchaeia archaeon]|nr:hypothetical protein [Candidatus Nanoarchaeia archaeon]